MITAQSALQARIDAQQDYETLVYGIRAAEAGGIFGSCPAYAGQIAAAVAIAGRRDLSALKAAKKEAAERVVEAKAAVKAFGTLRQLRLAIAEGGTDELAVAA